MERQIKLKTLATIVLLAFILCLGMAIMTDQVFAQGSMATINANGTIKEVNNSEEWEDALEVIDDLGQDTKATITLHSDITERVPELDGYRIEMTINLNGHTWTINDDISMETADSIIINGGGGTITIANGVYPSGLFCAYGTKYAVGIHVNDTNFVDCQCGRYPLFYMVGNSDFGSAASFTNCTFTNCSSKSYGGVFYGYRLQDGVRTDHCTFDGCHSAYGGIYYFEDTFIYDTEPRHTSILGVNDDVTTYKNCRADYAGGVLYLDNSLIGFTTAGKLEISNCSAPKGGAVYSDDSSDLYLHETGSMAEINIFNCTAEEGGVCYAEGETSIYSSNIHDCSATNGGVLYMYGDYLGELHSNTIQNCTASGLGGVLYCSRYDYTTFDSRGNTYIDSENSNKDGSIIYCENAILSSINETITSNNPHAIYNGGSFIGGSAASTILSNGALWIVAAVVGIVIGFVGGMFFGKKKTAANGN